MLEQTLRGAARWLQGKGGLLGLGLTALLISTGCGVGPGDYLVYRVAFSDPDLTPDCFGGTVPTDEAEDTSTLRSAGTFILYYGPNDKVYLDTGAVTLEGEEGGSGFAFAGNSFDVSISGVAPDEVRTTSESNVTIDFTLDGALIDGTLVDFQANTCTGPDGMCPDPASSACTQTSTFVGTQVDDVLIEHEL